MGGKQLFFLKLAFCGQQCTIFLLQCTFYLFYQCTEGRRKCWNTQKKGLGKVGKRSFEKSEDHDDSSFLRISERNQVWNFCKMESHVQCTLFSYLEAYLFAIFFSLTFFFSANICAHGLFRALVGARTKLWMFANVHTCKVAIEKLSKVFLKYTRKEKSTYLATIWPYVLR